MSDSPAVLLYDDAGKALAVKNGVAIPADTPGLLPLGKLASDGKSYYLEVVDDGGTKRLAVHAMRKAGDEFVYLKDPVNGYLAEVTSSKRLRVDARNSAGLGEVHEYLKYSGDAGMNYDGSSTPRVYSYSAGSDADVELTSISLIVEEPTISFGTTFWGEGGLTNGLLVELKVQGTTFTLCNLKYTRECLEVAEVGGFDLVAATPDFARVVRNFAPGAILKKQGTYPGNEDYIRATVRDNLGGLRYLRMVVRGVKVT